MSANTESQSNAMDSVKWLLVFGLLIAAVAGNYLYPEVWVLYRALGVVAAVIAAGLVAATTGKGQQAIAFAKESRTEVRKVVWPTRQEAIHTTLIVLVATAFMGLLLWLLDMGLVKIVSFLTGLEF